nr:odorant receptor SameORX [Schistocerca americana]
MAHHTANSGTALRSGEMADYVHRKPVVDIGLSKAALVVIGLWAPTRPSRLYWVYTRWSLLQLVVTIVGQVAGLQGHWDNLPVVSTSLCFVLTITCTFIKAVIFVTQRPRVDALMAHLEYNLATFCSFMPRVKEATLRGCRLRVLFMFTSFMGIGGITLFSFYTGPIVQNFKDAKLLADGASNVTVRPHMGRNLPMLMWWYNGQPEQTPYYQLTYVLMCYWLMLIYLACDVQDAFYVTLIIYLSAQLTMLNAALTNALHPGYGEGGHTSERRQLPSRGWRGDVESVVPAMRSGRDRLVECIRFHQEIIKSAAEMESILSASVLMQFMTSTLVICFTAFTVITAERAYLHTYITYLATMFYQLFLYCWYGGELLLESEKLQLSAYSCAWPDADPSLKRSLRIMMARLQNPVKLTACKLYGLTRETFLLLMNGSYSYFALLHRMNQAPA